MTITDTEFFESVATLHAFGLPRKDTWELRYWYRAIESAGLTNSQVQEATLQITKNTIKFWDTDNIPARIIELAAQNAEERSQIALKQQFLLAYDKDKAEKMAILESYGATEEERGKNQAAIKFEIRRMLKRSFK